MLPAPAHGVIDNVSMAEGDVGQMNPQDRSGHFEAKNRAGDTSNQSMLEEKSKRDSANPNATERGHEAILQKPDGQNEKHEQSKIDPHSIKQNSNLDIEFLRSKGDGQSQATLPTADGSPLKRVETADYSSFSPVGKKFIVLTASIGAFFSVFTTMIYFPALNTIASDLNVSISQINLTITTYMIFQGIAPSFTSTLSDRFGRRPSYVLGFATYMAANIGLALNKSFAGLLVLRCLQSSGSAGLATLKTAVIADVVTSAERGSYIAFTSVGAILGPSIAPIIGGALSGSLGWHWIFWFLFILSVAYFIPLVLFFPETGRRVVGDGSIPPPKWNRSLINVLRKGRGREGGNEPEVVAAGNAAKEEKHSEREIERPLQLQWRSLLSPVCILGEPETALILLFGGLDYAGFYAINASLTTQFSKIYHLSDTELGLLFLPQALGSLFAAFTNGKLLDANYRRHARKLGMPIDKRKLQDLSHFPIERVRLEIGLPMHIIGAVCIIVYGWLINFEIQIAAPLVFLFCLGYVVVGAFSTLTALIVDLHRRRPATASAAFNLVRCLLGAGSTAIVTPMINRLGRGWTFTLIGLLEMMLVPIVLLVMKKGPEWRREEAEKQKRRKLEEQGKKEKIDF